MLRFVLSAAFVFIAFPRRILSLSGASLKAGIILGCFLFLGFALQTIGMQYTTASKSAFFTGMLVVLTPVVHFFAQNVLAIRRKPLKLGNLLGVACAAIGLYLLTSPSGGSFNVGDFLTLICALTFAFYIVYLDTVSPEVDKMQMTFVMFMVCGVMGFGSALLFERIQVDYSGTFIVALLYLTIFATVVAMGVQNRYQGDTTPTRAALIFALEPVIAGILAYVVRGELIGAPGVVGGGVILTGLLLSEFSDEIPGLNRSLTREEEIGG